MNTIYTLKKRGDILVFIEKLPFTLYPSGADCLLWSELDKEKVPFYFSGYYEKISRPATDEELKRA